MARQTGSLKITGTIDNLTFHQMDGRYYVRTKSSLTRKRVLRNPAFKRSLQRVELFGIASNIAAALYKQLPQSQKGKNVIGKLTGQVFQLLMDESTPEEILPFFMPLEKTGIHKGE
jgi:hypothetical protein